MASLVPYDISDIPRHWIGIESGWQNKPHHPAQYLVSLTPDDLVTHALLLGKTGCGKTNLLLHLIAQDVLLGNSLVILDLRGDLVRSALEICAGRVEPNLLKIIDLREKKCPMGFDPLTGPGEAYFYALNVQDTVCAESESWGVQLAETMRNAFIALSESGLRLTDLERFLYEPAFRFRAIANVRSANVTGFWLRYGAMTVSAQAALAAPVLNKVSVLFATESLRKVLGHPSPIALREHLDTRGSVLLVSLAADELGSAGRMLGSILLGSICREVVGRVDTLERKRNPVRLYVDEFENFGSQGFETILAEARKFKLSLVLAHQTLSQLNPKLRASVLGNVGCKCVFRCGREDSETMAKDIFRARNASDFSKLRTGTAVICKTGTEPLGVEINAPICEGGGRLSVDARELLQAAYEAAGCGEVEETLPDHPVEPEIGTPLEAWL